MKKNLWIAAAAFAIVLGAAGYTIAQSAGTPQGWMMGSGMMRMMSGQPLSPEQLEQFAKQHGITVEQAKQMADACTQIMAGTAAPETPKQ
jgi:hypothetical protein